MKKTAQLFGVFVVTAALLLASGALLQRNHAFTPLKRMLQGRPFAVAPPTQSILEWDVAQRENRQPEFPLMNLTFKEIEEKRLIYLEKLRELLRLSEYPHHFPSKTRTLERIDLPKVIREKVEMEVEPGLWIPFYLLIPKEYPLPRPCILVIHGHSAGKIETAGLVPSYQNGNALALAEAGFVTAAPDLRGFGELGWSGDWEDPIGHGYGRSIHIQHVLYSLQAGRTTLASFIYDNQKIMDYLVTRKEVDRRKIAITGTSMGADVAIWTSLLDPRIKAVAASAIQFFDHPSSASDFGRYHACIHAIPGINKYFRVQQIPLLAAPRPILFLGNPAIRPKLEALYQEAGNPDKLSFWPNPGKETYNNEAAVVWFRKWLGS